MTRMQLFFTIVGVLFVIWLVMRWTRSQTTRYVNDKLTEGELKQLKEQGKVDISAALTEDSDKRKRYIDWYERGIA